MTPYKVRLCCLLSPVGLLLAVHRPNELGWILEGCMTGGTAPWQRNSEERITKSMYTHYCECTAFTWVSRLHNDLGQH